MNLWGQFWWVIFPYGTLLIMVAGSIYRFLYSPLSWSARSSELLEKRMLRWGSLLFHWGILFVIAGHVIGLLIPVQVFEAVGIHREFYHLNADIFGGLAGFATWLGLLILIYRRFADRRVRANSSVGDYAALLVLFAAVTTGDLVTIVHNNLFGPFGYRHTVSPWVRGLLTLHPDAALMARVPLILQIHIVAAFAVFATVPFTRLVHFWSVPLGYPRRAPIQYRSRSRYRSESR